MMDWQNLTIEELASPEKGAIKIGPFGSQLKKEELVDKGIHVVGIENVLQNDFDGVGDRYISHEKFETLRSVEINPGDVLVTMMGTIGKVAIVPENIATTIMDSHLLRIRPNSDLCSSQYLAWLLKGSSSTKRAIAGKAHGAIMKGLNSKIVRSLPAPLPPPSEQNHIVEILDQADALRKLQAEAYKKAERILPAIFYSIFGDPSTNPKRWDMKQLRQTTIGNPQYGANASASEWSDGDPRYVRITDIAENGQLKKDGIVSLKLKDWKQYQLFDGDVLFARSGNTVGKTYLYNKKDGLCAYAGYLIRFKMDASIALPEYIFALTHTGYYKSWVNSKKRVGGQPNINGKEYASFQFPCPPLNIQRSFLEKMKPADVVRTMSELSHDKIQKLFDVLVHRAFSGELTADWRESHMKELLQEMEVQTRILGDN
jgi:type I restriction enzyme, S subunit